MSPYNERQAYPIVKSESPSIRSITISSASQSHSQHSDTGSPFRFGSGEYTHLPSFGFMPQPGLSPSTWPHHTPHHPANPYATTASSPHTHFTLPSMDDSTVLTLTDECDDGDELCDLPSGSGSVVDIFHESSSSSSKISDKTVRRRSSKGASRWFIPLLDP
jgi:hypothetical protein